MKKTLMVFVLLIVAGFIFISYSVKKNNTVLPTPIVSLVPTKSQNSECTKDQLQAIITIQGAAGSIYGKLELINISKTNCRVTLGNTVAALLQPTTNNIDIHYVQVVNSEPFILSPMAKAYSQVRIPNGPQCQNGIKQKKVGFIYKIDAGFIFFVQNSPDAEKVTIQACSAASENTIMDIWPLSKEPITE